MSASASSALLPPPLLPPMQRCDLERATSAKCCRICLEDDDPDSMIAPCLCKGSQKWVHTSCLDLWRQNEHDRAFGRCTECQFSYHFQEERSHSVVWRHTKFCLFVSRDLCCVTVLLQLVIGLLGWITFLIDIDERLPLLLDGSTTCTQNDSGLWCNHKLTVYYMFGLLEMFAMMGLAASVSFCCNGCKIPDLSCNNSAAEPPPSLTWGTDRESESQRRRRSSYYRRRRYRNDHCFCVDCGPYCYYGGGDCCDCCCGQGCGSCCAGSNACGACPTSSGGSSSSSNDCSHVLLIILLVVVVVMAVVGFFVGLFLAVVLTQRVVQNHLFRLQKKQLVEEFRVKDMSGFAVEAAPGAIHQAPPLMPPKMHPDDEAHLKKLGLLTDE